MPVIGTLIKVNNLRRKINLDCTIKKTSSGSPGIGGVGTTRDFSSLGAAWSLVSSTQVFPSCLLQSKYLKVLFSLKLINLRHRRDVISLSFGHSLIFGRSYLRLSNIPTWGNHWVPKFYPTKVTPSSKRWYTSTPWRASSSPKWIKHPAKKTPLKFNSTVLSPQLSASSFIAETWKVKIWRHSHQQSPPSIIGLSWKFIVAFSCHSQK